MRQININIILDQQGFKLSVNNEGFNPLERLGAAAVLMDHFLTDLKNPKSDIEDAQVVESVLETTPLVEG